MRRTVDAIFLVGTLAILAGIFSFRAEGEREWQRVETVAEELRRLELMVKYRAATGEVELTGRGWPTTIDPGWFGEEPPQNTLLSPMRPWVEVVTPDQADLLHPEIRIATDSDQAGFWYNPYQGLVRARVPPAVNDRRALEMYNRVNGCQIDSLLKPAPRAAQPASGQPAPANPTSHTDPADSNREEAVESEVLNVPAIDAAG